jgi:hypothetical protein
LAKQADEIEQKSARPGYGFIAKVIAFLGVLQLYNIVAHHQSLLDLSQSVKLLAAWWRYGLTELFGFLHFDLPPLERELLTLLILSGSAANFAFFRRNGSFLFSRMLRETLTSNANYAAMLGFEEKTPATVLGFAFTSIILVGLAFVVVAAMPLWVILYSVFTIIVLFILVTVEPSDDNLLFLIVFGLASPLIFVLMWIFMTASYFREIFRACRYLLLVLGADLMFRYIIDPMLPWLSSLPAPPPA